MAKAWLTAAEYWRDLEIEWKFITKHFTEDANALEKAEIQKRRLDNDGRSGSEINAKKRHAVEMIERLRAQYLEISSSRRSLNNGRHDRDAVKLIGIGRKRFRRGQFRPKWALGYILFQGHRNQKNPPQRMQMPYAPISTSAGCRLLGRYSRFRGTTISDNVLVKIH